MQHFDATAITALTSSQGATTHAPAPGQHRLCGPCGDQSSAPEARSVSHMRRALKGGNINQGYAQCDVDTLALLVERGECPVERIQCRQVATMRVLALVAGATVTFTVDPVGPAFARELITVFAQADDPADTDFIPILLQMEAQGRQAITGNVTSSIAASNVPRGAPLGAWGRDFQNYVVPSGISFNSSNELSVQITNAGLDTGSLVVGLTYDLIRAG